MAPKKIIWSERAEQELRSILNYYVERNGNSIYSLKLLQEVENLTNLLSKNKYLGRLSSNKTTRIIPFDAYLLFYDIGPNGI